MKTKDYVAAANRLIELSDIFRLECAARILKKSGFNPDTPDYGYLLRLMACMAGAQSVTRTGWGKYDIKVIIAPPPPLDRITYTSYIDPELLNQILKPKKDKWKSN